MAEGSRLLPLSRAWEHEKVETQVALWCPSIGEVAARHRAQALIWRLRLLVEASTALVGSMALQLLNADIGVAIEAGLGIAGFIVITCLSARQMRKAQQLTAARLGMKRGRRWIPMSEPEALSRWVERYADRYR